MVVTVLNNGKLAKPYTIKKDGTVAPLYEVDKKETFGTSKLDPEKWAEKWEEGRDGDWTNICHFGNKSKYEENLRKKKD